MIARLRGKLVALEESVAVIDVAGVGYEVEVTVGAAARLTASPDAAVVYTHLIVRDDAQILFGFASVAERTLFRSLIKVAGVGPKLGLALLSAVTPDQFAAAVASGDVAAITRVPGIGKKTASRLVMELRDKVDGAAVAEAVGGASSATREAALALVALGYRERDAAQVVRDVANGLAGEPAVEDLVREALRRLAA